MLRQCSRLFCIIAYGRSNKTDDLKEFGDDQPRCMGSHGEGRPGEGDENVQSHRAELLGESPSKLAGRLAPQRQIYRRSLRVASRKTANEDQTGETAALTLKHDKIYIFRIRSFSYSFSNKSSEFQGLL